ncbi:peptidoglycan DD-metalloendopeptidase family protein [Iodidimonas gelatinilytica]|uniref:peptidoglycan DD-metalloendopeptidase family protein n=1 Tax=Iodidimonas gelatinilytica TaxID=1236966 RepID=UPI0022A79324|nr:peptidoglycan DD-metalloendopeptidase family protein [Iodidimonas gelatinilytica]
MRFHRHHIRRQVTHLFHRLFPERQIFFRSRGEVRFVRLSPRSQAFTASLALGIVGWTLSASIAYVSEDSRVAAKQHELDYVSGELDSLVSELERLQSDALIRTQRLEARQKLLERVSGTMGALHADSQQPSAVENDSGTDGNELPTALDGDSSAAPVSDTALGEEAHLQDTGVLFSLLGIKPASALTSRDVSVYALSTGVDTVFEILERVSDRQDVMARLLAKSEQQKLTERRTMIERLGLPVDLLIASVQTESGTGGPLLESPPAFLSEPFQELSEIAQQRDLLDQSLAHIPSHIPAKNYYVSSHFGPRRDPFRKSWATHSGVDLAGWPGEAILASAPGKVIAAGRRPAYGLMVEIDHGNGLRTRYGHMRKLLVKAGQTVTSGDQIGEMGSTGRSTSTHLHWEVWFNDELVDPLPFIKRLRMFKSSSKADMKKAEQAPIGKRDSASDAPSIISASVLITGDIESPGEIQLDGDIKGNVHCTSLTLGETGSILGKVVANSITLRGQVEGEVIGAVVRLEKTARISGDIMHQTLSVEAGARLSGNIIHAENPLSSAKSGFEKEAETKEAPATTRTEKALSGTS